MALCDEHNYHNKHIMFLCTRYEHNLVHFSFLVIIIIGSGLSGMPISIFFSINGWLVLEMLSALLL